MRVRRRLSGRATHTESSDHDHRPDDPPRRPVAVDEAGDPPHRRDERHTEQQDAGDGQPDAPPQARRAGRPLTEPVQDHRADEAEHGEHRAGQGDAERPPARRVEVDEALGERCGQQEGEQDLHAGEDDPQLLQEAVVALPQLVAVVDVVELGGVPVGVRAPSSSSVIERWAGLRTRSSGAE